MVPFCANAGTATFADGTEPRFDVVGADPLSDLAVLRPRRNVDQTRRPPASGTNDRAAR